MSQLTLNYFDAYGRAELARLVLAASGTQYTDRRINWADWPTVKQTTPLGQVPYLEVDDVVLPQSLSIARYLARRGNLVGRTPIEEAQADAVVDTVTDAYNVFVRKIVANVAAGNQAAVEEGTKSFLENDLVAQVGNVERLVQRYGSNGYSVGDSLTWADLAVHDFRTKAALALGESALSQFEQVNNVVRRVEEQANVAAYLASRPKSAF